MQPIPSNFEVLTSRYFTHLIMLIRWAKIKASLYKIVFDFFNCNSIYLFPSSLSLSVCVCVCVGEQVSLVMFVLVRCNTVLQLPRSFNYLIEIHFLFEFRNCPQANKPQ